MKRTRGIALFLVLVTTAVVVALVGFFVAVNEQNLQNYKVQMQQTRALQAAQSGLSYIRYCLEYDRTWALKPFTAGDQPLPITGLRTQVVGNSRILTGTFIDSQGQPTGDTFEALILNNAAQLGVSAPAPFSEDFIGSTVKMTLPGDTILVRIQGRCGSFQKTVEANFVGGPLYDSAATSLKAIDLSGNSRVTVASKDSMRNWLRSNQSITFQDFVNTPSTVKFEFRDQNGVPLASRAPARSMIWAKGDINLLNKAVGSPTDDPTGQLLAAASAKSGAELTPRSNLNRQINNLKLSDLKKPDPSKEFTIPGGSFDFAYREFRAKYDYKVTNNLGQVESKSATTVAYVPYLTWTDKSGTLNWYDSSQANIQPSGVPDKAFDVNLSDIVNDMGTSVGTTLPGINVPTKSSVEVPSTGSPLSFRFDSMGNSFKLDASKALKVEGDFHIGAPKLGKSTKNVNTSLQRPTITFAGGSGQDTPFLYSETGSVEIQGTVVGRGGIASATGNVSVYAGTSTNLSAGTTDSLVLYGGNDVTLNADDKSNINFRGLIYADKNINFTAIKTNQDWTTSPGTLNRLSIEGAVVARAGNLDMQNAQDLDLTYNPAYLTQFTKGLRNNRNSIKLTNWRVL